METNKNLVWVEESYTFFGGGLDCLYLDHTVYLNV